jgi:hypothetical protein
MKWLWLFVAACSSPAPKAAPDATSPDAPGFPAPLADGDFARPLDKAHIRAPQTWIDDAAFEVKWAAMKATPIDFLGGADSAFHADLPALPGALALCHGDAKLDNFGWVLADSATVFSDVDFDDAGECPAAADALHFLVSTDLLFSDPSLDAAVLAAYVDTLRGVTASADPATQPVWDDLRKTGVDHDTSNDQLTLGGDVSAPSAADLAAIDSLQSVDLRFPRTLVDVAAVATTTGGSAGLRRYWLLVEDSTHPRTIIELKELATPGTEFGAHAMTYDGTNRFDVLKPYWWGEPATNDHFLVEILGGRFVARDKFRHAKASPDALTQSQRLDLLVAEASLLAQKHHDAWQGVDPDVLAAWLRASATTLTARWRAAFLDTL